MINNKVLESELKDTEKKIEDLLLRIKELRKEVSEITPKQKVLYEQHIVRENMLTRYFVKSKINEDTIIINYVKSHYKKIGYGKYYGHGPYVDIANNTSKIIETYIPSKNIVLVVEL